jgi:hypothetical protein
MVTTESYNGYISFPELFLENIGSALWGSIRLKAVRLKAVRLKVVRLLGFWATGLLRANI